MKHFLLNIILLVASIATFSQPKQKVYVSGTVYDISARNPIEAVSVASSSGKGAVTDSLGKYTIQLNTTDTIWFSMLGKTTKKFPIDTIKDLNAFDVSILLQSSDLPEVKVRNKYYKLDSITNRQDYAKVFNFKKPGISLLSSGATARTYIPGQVTVGLDLQEIINMFRFKRNKSLATLQKRLIQQEQDKYVDFRFNKNFVRKLTKLLGKELDHFMTAYRPSYEFVTALNDLELGYFIQRDFEHYKANKQAHKE